MTCARFADLVRNREPARNDGKWLERYTNLIRPRSEEATVEEVRANESNMIAGSGELCKDDAACKQLQEKWRGR